MDTQALTLDHSRDFLPYGSVGQWVRPHNREAKRTGGAASCAARCPPRVRGSTALNHTGSMARKQS